LAEKAVDIAFAGTVTEAGTVTKDVLDESLIVVPPLGATVPRVTVQFAAVFGKRAAVEHWSAETTDTATTVTVALADEPFRDAVIVAV
jgi:hypothetical protein